MTVVDAVYAPRSICRIFTPIFVPFDFGLLAEHIGYDKRTDVEPHTVIEIRSPAYGLLFEWFPAHEDIIRIFALQDKLEFFLELLSGQQTSFRTANVLLEAILLPPNPITQIGIGESLQPSAIQLVVVDEGTKTIPSPAVPDMPDEGTLVEELAMLLKKAVT
ncbi:hypothetical protein HN588_13105 [Candidatus Bathyarchaeota archaeon]|nr:hypothetical protein [Candidatus Bathyarchaeota archaeon]